MNILLLDDGESELPGSDARARHIRKVLHLGVGDTLRAGRVGGPPGTAHIVSMDTTRIRLVFEPELQRAVPPRPASVIDMILGHPRPIVLRRVIRDLCTIGVRRLIVVPTELGERSYHGATMWKNIRPLLIEGAAQAGTTELMEVVRARSLAAALHDTATARSAGDEAPREHRVVLHPGNTGTNLVEVLTNGSVTAGSPRSTHAVLAIGSERGWTETEVRSIRDAGFVVAGMGVRILRTETAATVAAAMASALLGEGAQ